MGIFDEIKSFVHSITTEDHYASFDSPYKNSTISGTSGSVSEGGSSSSRLHELGRLAGGNSSSQSLNNSSRNNSQTNVVGYRPGLRSSATNLNGSDLQLQNLNASGQPPLPSIDSLWNRIETWVDEEYPELGDNLNYGVTTADLNEFENDISCGSLPVEFRQFYKIHDGQMRGGEPTGLILGLTLLDIESIAEEYKIWGKVAVRLEKQQYIMQHQSKVPGSLREGTSSSSGSPYSAGASGPNNLNNNFLANQKSLPPQAVQCVYSHKGWIPFVKDDGGNQIAIDLAPGPTGIWGQIIIFGRDFDTKIVIASSFQEFIFNFVTDLENGNFQIDQDEGNESYGYLEISRNDDDYMIGAEEENQGELNFLDRSKEFTKSKEKLSYIEVQKRRALRKFGISNIEHFSTSFVPHRIKKTNPAQQQQQQQQSQQQSQASDNKGSGFGTPRTTSPSVIPKVSSPLINMEASASQVGLTKETLIDETKKEEAITNDDPKVEKNEESTTIDTTNANATEPEAVVETIPEAATEPESVPEEIPAADEEPEVEKNSNSGVDSVADDLKEVAI
ncbi:KNR4/SMI1 homolog 2 [[Candida] railenensis]|uniref:KNR4/SMI1 homolog 2 n=1 Tax=[Candida] railenensis TaxID=45579 RepID=A0A9P0QRZ6_9ASCO|nr:KNR4/SMI1 homolog 2 [[Candida] railenensis]